MSNPVKQYLWRQKIHRGLQKHAERWKMFIDGEHWICPYCADIGFRCTNENMLQEQILDHFSNDCDNWKAGKGEMLQPASLKQRAEKTAVRFRLQKRPVWRIYDLDNHWYCPYCSKVTEIERPLGNKISDDLIERVNLHLRSCTQASTSATDSWIAAAPTSRWSSTERYVAVTSPTAMLMSPSSV